MWTDKGDINGTFEKYHGILTKYGCTDADVLDLQNRWNEPHRVYHNQEHLDEILGLIEHRKFYLKATSDPMSDADYENLICIAFFHDAVYDPGVSGGNNEAESFKLFAKMCKSVNADQVALIKFAIQDTVDHTQEPSSPLSKLFLTFDLHGMMHGSLSRMISDESKIMREFGFVDYDTYHNVRGTKFLEKFAPHIKKINPDSKVEEYLDWFKNQKPRIAIYPGSFYPFHKGHLDILKRAERMFDKVIILMCVNPSKSNNAEVIKSYMIELRKKLPNNQIEFHDGMLHNYIKLLNYPVSIVKGLRNASDFDAEKLQLRYMEDMCPDINIVYVVSDRKYEHVSSSAIKQIQSMGAINEAKEYLI